MMKYTLLALAFLLVSGNAHAVCSGGFDGKDAIFEGCSEMGELGDLLSKFDANGKEVGQRNDDEIKAVLISRVEERLKSRGMTMRDKDGGSSINIGSEDIDFDVYNQNGDFVFHYHMKLKNGIPENEEELISSRQNYTARKETRQNMRKEYLKEIQALGDRIKAEEIDTKAAAKK